MKLLCRLPDKKFFRPISGTEEWQYIWELRQSNRLRLYARNGDPWSGENGEVVITIRAAKTGNQSKNQERHCNRFDLIVANSSDDIEGECEIIFQISQGLPYFTGRNFGVYSFPITEFTGKGNTIFMIIGMGGFRNPQNPSA